MSLKDIEIYRTYKCTECEGIIGLTQGAVDDFIKDCPFCGRQTMLMDSAETNLTFLFDLKKPKTLGMIAQTNEASNEKEYGPAEPKWKPWWRDKHRVNFDILKNPSRYIEEGRI